MDGALVFIFSAINQEVGVLPLAFDTDAFTLSLSSTAEATREHYACVHAVFCGMKLADPGITAEPRGRTASQSRPVDIFTTAAVPGRSAALDVASSMAAAARGDAAQAAFDRKLSQNRNEIGELRQQGIHCRPLVWTADGRPRPAVTRALQYAAHETGSIRRRNNFIAGGNTKSKSLSCAGERPWLARFS